MGGDANGNYCSLMAVTIHLRQLLFIRVDCIVDCLGGGGLHGWSCSHLSSLSGESPPRHHHHKNPLLYPRTPDNHTTRLLLANPYELNPKFVLLESSIRAQTELCFGYGFSASFP